MSAFAASSTQSKLDAPASSAKSNALSRDDQINQLKAELASIGRSQAVIEFDTHGIILDANENFLSTVGYRLDEIRGQHHGMFVDEAYRRSPEYQSFWRKLAAGEYQAGEYHRFGKGGREIWLQASYNPVLDSDGKPFKVVKFAADITQHKLDSFDTAGQISAINKSQAVIEFDTQGNILNANENFLATVGYRLDEIRGQHHGMFVEEAYRRSPEYQSFWRKLAAGEYQAGEFRRFGKGGREIWLQASYNPILDFNGKPLKIVKYASDITRQKTESADFAGQLNAINKSQAVIEFELDGTIRHANDNFLSAVGYRLEEIRGQHHGMFVGDQMRRSAEYQNFWRNLAAGEYQAGEFQRFGKGGREIWLQASYNPILDANGKPFKVVKYASDITAQVNLRNDLREMVKSVIGAAAQFTEGSRVIAESSQTLARGAQTQSSAVEQMSASVNGLTSSIKTVKQSADQADEMARQTNALAAEGGAAVHKSIEAMQLIKTSSEQISEITQVISEIASQTNLLALNAAIEAARAGEHGLGFAVVADEVRKLAERSSHAAKEISSLIKESTRRVDEGANLSTQTGQSLAKIVEGVAGTASRISQIASVVSEQAQNADELARAITNVSGVTEEVASGSEEMAASSEELGAQARELREMVTRFQLN
jgi:methyl-accepting chemotaxis protein